MSFLKLTIEPLELKLQGSLNTDDGDVNQTGKKAVGFNRLAKQQLCACITLFLYIFYRHCTTTTKRPDFTFCGRREQQKTTFFVFL